MTVIAMTREMGTLGKDVAAGLATRLGIEVIHQELVEQHLAERLNTSESAVHRFLEGEATLWERWNIDSRRLSKFTAEEILELALRGNVLIRGWGAAQLLRDVPHVICARVCAPMSKRIGVMMQRLGVSNPDTIRREIERSDEAHHHTVQQRFQSDWQDPVNYDIVLNTAHVPVDVAIATLQQLAKSGIYEMTDKSRSALNDRLLESKVRTVLDGTRTPLGVEIDVSVKNGAVVLGGVLTTEMSLAAIIPEIERIDGIRSVHNDTVKVRMNYGP